MILLASVITLVLYIEGMLTPSLPQIQSDFSITTGEASLILSSYIITGVALSPVVGKLGDIYGKKKLLGIVISIYAVCVSVTGFSPNYTFMVSARAFQGIGLTIFPLGMSLVREEFPRDMIPKAQGILSAMFGAGFAISLPLGAWVSNNYGWRTTYHSAIPFVIVLALLTFLIIRESRFRRPETRVDYLGASLLGGSLAAFVLALSEGSNWGWLSGGTLALVALGGVLLVPLVVYELKFHAAGGEAILDFRLLRERNVLVTNVLGTVAGLGMYLALLSMVFLFEDPKVFGGYQLSTFQAGLYLVPLAVGMLIFGAVAGFVVSRIGARTMTAIGSGVTAVAFLLAIPVHPLTTLLIVEFFIGAGIGMVNAGMINLLVLTVDPRDMGLATSLMSVFRNIGSAVGAPLSGSLLTTLTLTVVLPGLGAKVGPSFVAFQWSFAIAAVCFAFAGGFVILGREVLGRHAVPEPAPAGSAVPGPPLPSMDAEPETVLASPTTDGGPRD